MKKNIENSDMPISSPTMFAPRSVRSRKIENGISGWRERDSITTKAPSSTTAAAMRASVCAEVQPARRGVDQRVDEQREAGGHGERARRGRRSRVLGVVAALREQPRRERRGDEADRHVDEQHPLPARRTRSGCRRAARPRRRRRRRRRPRRRAPCCARSPRAKVVVTIDSAAGETIAAPRPCTRAGGDQPHLALREAAGSEATENRIRPSDEHAAPARAGRPGGRRAAGSRRR